MARIQTSGLITNISGKVNGSVFQRNQGGLIMRNQSAKINSNTQRSNSQRVGMSSIQGDWQNLTDNQRLVWNTYAQYLNSKQWNNNSLAINGQQIFVRINAIRYALKTDNALFQPYLLVAPTFAALPLPNPLDAVRNIAGVLSLRYSTALVAANQVAIGYMSRPLSGSQTSANIKTTLMKFATVNGVSQTVTDAYISVYGRVLEVGEWVQTEVAIYDTNMENFSSYSVSRQQVA
jgi:hypothetical protein